MHQSPPQPPSSPTLVQPPTNLFSSLSSHTQTQERLHDNIKHFFPPPFLTIERDRERLDHHTEKGRRRTQAFVYLHTICERKKRKKWNKYWKKRFVPNHPTKQQNIKTHNTSFSLARNLNFTYLYFFLSLSRPITLVTFSTFLCEPKNEKRKNQLERSMEIVPSHSFPSQLTLAKPSLNSLWGSFTKTQTSASFFKIAWGKTTVYGYRKRYDKVKRTHTINLTLL